ncbi:hypothetical protein NECAME_01813 [Necator americanus]|uniref:Uncharacterized protein n=1 Tax=Necator americanus TaxID=51031 RepID=W2TQV7_NECAM|nr:hypothetical protein NECAME_01813 [Necator americanus]ETN83506.1 hypothetical protein NECAME_01813 [Necator americanus]
MSIAHLRIFHGNETFSGNIGRQTVNKSSTDRSNLERDYHGKLKLCIDFLFLRDYESEKSGIILDAKSLR